MTDSNEMFSISRREMLSRAAAGMGTLAMASLFSQEAGASQSPLAVKTPHFAPKVKRVIHLFMNGGPSQVDTFDPKPMLAKYDGKPFPDGSLKKTERATGGVMKSPFKFSKHGESGIDVSELFPSVAKHADDLCVLRGMHTDVPNHEPSLMMMNCGEIAQSRPSLGSWALYGLGTENQNLPGFVVLCPNSLPTGGSPNWRSSFLPGIFQGTRVDTSKTNVKELLANISNERVTPQGQSDQLGLIQQLNQRHLAARGGDERLESRIQAFELAFRMQMEASDAFDVSRESSETLAMYGDDLQGRQMLTARRLVERGVRFVQVWHGGGQPWDSHNDIERLHRKLAGECDQAIGALLTDLKQRGLLDDTLVIWGGEFGRTPAVELPNSNNDTKGTGRDHNNHGFSMWLAGAGVKPGHIHGATDEFGFGAVEGKMHVHDLHATLLHLLGFDHERLTYRWAGRDFRLTDVHGTVCHDILA
ncbi:hypothetical protein SV7mr_27580 [Stieleria bergensis]|uniref:Sulfatase n=1 Tax=Stieleria bergensis TaxID=2528025 RepID=A0A517SVU3_9BACT|nr:hypothetical protein SV7mr_27580 [Planctomycetes bacterium SV_7m_r]